jgi:hypothetical protein
MQHPDGLPILGQASQNGGANVAAIDRTYAVILCTMDGGEHTVTMRFAPQAGKDGVIDLGAVRSFNPERQAMENTARNVHLANYGVEMGVDPKNLPVIVVAEGGMAVVWRHVVSFRYLGAADELTPAAGEAA